MSLFKAEHHEGFKTPGRYRFTVTGYRTYPNEGKRYYADANRMRYRRLLFALKKNDPDAISLFTSLLCLIFDDVIGGPDAIACVPPSSQSAALRDDAMALVARKAVEKDLGVIDGSSWLKRTQTVPKAHQDSSMRSFEKQYATIACTAGSLAVEPKSIVVIDDICTSGTTMQACVTRLREQFPNAKVTGFAFGYTGWVNESPSVPEFPDEKCFPLTGKKTIDAWRDEAWPLASDAAQSPFFAHHGQVHGFNRSCVRPEAVSEPVWSKAEADAKQLIQCRSCKPFQARPRFQINFNSRTIHHLDCHTGPSGKGHKPLWSLRQGIRLGGKPCRNCMDRWPIAAKLYQEWQQQSPSQVASVAAQPNQGLLAWRLLLLASRARS